MVEVRRSAYDVSLHILNTICLSVSLVPCRLRLAFGGLSLHVLVHVMKFPLFFKTTSGHCATVAYLKYHGKAALFPSYRIGTKFHCVVMAESSYCPSLPYPLAHILLTFPRDPVFFFVNPSHVSGVSSPFTHPGLETIK